MQIAQLPVERFMTPSPFTIEVGAPMIEAHVRMRENNIRHLPVLRDGELVGVVSMGDLHLLEAIDTTDLQSDPVEDAMSDEPYVVGSEAPLRDVVMAMRDRKIGSAIVVKNGEPVGVFTTVDALAALLDRLG